MQAQIESKPKELFLTYPQDKFIFCKDQFVCIKGTWGCGKSLAGLFAANKECEENPGNLYLVIRKEWTDLRDSTIHDWNRWIGREIDGSKEVHYPNGSVLMFRHGADINALKNANLGGALMIQAEEMNEEDFWFLNGRLRRESGTRQLRIECNYDGHNWIYKLFNQQGKGTLITTNTFDNQKNLPADYIPRLQLLPKKLQERHLYGSDADMEGIVWDEYSEGKHVINPFNIPIGWEKTVVLDHGVTNPTAVLFCAVDFDGNAYIYNEHYEANKTISYHAERIKAIKGSSEIQRWLIDPSCSNKISSKNGVMYSVVDEYKDSDLYFTNANNDVLAGINRVNDFFKANKLFIFKNCVNLVEEIGQYKWQKLRPGEEKNEPDRPVKHKDHACDALRYFVMSRSESNYEVVINPEKWSVAWAEKRMQSNQTGLGIGSRTVKI